MFNFFSKSDPFSLKLLKIILAACLATPILAFSGVIFPYTVPKVFAFRVLVEIAAVFYLYLALKYSTNFFTPLFKGGRGGILNFSILVFFILSFLSALFGADFYSSFWGNLERGGGLFGLLHFVVFFFILASVFRIDSLRKQIPPCATPEASARRANLPFQREEKNKIPPFLKGGEGGFKSQSFSHQLIIVSVFTSTLVSLIAILQHFFSLSDLLPQADRVYSLIGNAGVLGSYLIFNIFLAGYLVLSESVILRERSNRRIYFPLYSLFIILNSFALLLSATRGAWLGLLAGIVIFLVLTAWQSQQKKWRKFAIWGLAIIFVLVALLFIIRDSFFVQTNPTLSRLTSISLTDSTTQSRLILWQGAWQAWQSKPLLGSGPENFESAIGKYLSPKLASFEAYSTDRAHNFIFDYGVTIGWLGLLSYLSIFIVAGYFLFTLSKVPQKGTESKGHSERSVSEEKNLKTDPSAQRPQDDKIRFLFSPIFISLLVAYLVQNIFIFDSFVSYLMLFFVLALINNVRHPEHSEESRGSVATRATSSLDSSSANWRTQNDKKGGGHPERSEGSMSLSKKLLLLFVIGNLSFVIYAYNLKPFLAANYANQILPLPASEAEQIAPLLKNVIALNSFASPEITYQVTLDYIEKISQNPAMAQNEEFYSVASAELSRIIARSPNKFKNYIALSWLNLYFSGQEKTRVDQSLQLAQKVRELSPNKKDAYLLLVAGYALSNQPQKARQVVDQAIAIDAKMGEEVRGYYEKLK